MRQEGEADSAVRRIVAFQLHLLHAACSTGGRTVIKCTSLSGHGRGDTAEPVQLVQHRVYGCQMTSVNVKPGTWSGACMPYMAIMAIMMIMMLISSMLSSSRACALKMHLISHEWHLHGALTHRIELHASRNAHNRLVCAMPS